MRRWMASAGVATATLAAISTSAAAHDSPHAVGVSTTTQINAPPQATDPSSSHHNTHFPRNLTLKQVSVVFRHGARTPLTEKYIDNIQWDDCSNYRDTVQVGVLKRKPPMRTQQQQPWLICAYPPPPTTLYTPPPSCMYHTPCSCYSTPPAEGPAQQHPGMTSKSRPPLLAIATGGS